MTTILTDADGNKFELSPLHRNLDGKMQEIEGVGSKFFGYTLKPVQPEEEKQYDVALQMFFRENDMDQLVHKDIEHMTPTQATALADAVKALVEYCTTDTPGNVYVRDAADRARQALQGKKVG